MNPEGYWSQILILAGERAANANNYRCNRIWLQTFRRSFPRWFRRASDPSGPGSTSINKPRDRGSLDWMRGLLVSAGLGQSGPASPARRNAHPAVQCNWQQSAPPHTNEPQRSYGAAFASHESTPTGNCALLPVHGLNEDYDRLVPLAGGRGCVPHLAIGSPQMADDYNRYLTIAALGMATGAR
jgi:hypothetical protein